MGFPNAYYLKVHYLPVESEPLISELESFFAALADKTRLQITLFLLSKEGATVQEISESLGKSQSLISHHLACLRNCGVVRVEKRGKVLLLLGHWGTGSSNPEEGGGTREVLQVAPSSPVRWSRRREWRRGSRFSINHFKISSPTPDFMESQDLRVLTSLP